MLGRWIGWRQAASSSQVYQWLWGPRPWVTGSRPFTGIRQESRESSTILSAFTGQAKPRVRPVIKLSTPKPSSPSSASPYTGQPVSVSGVVHKLKSFNNYKTAQVGVAEHEWREQLRLVVHSVPAAQDAGGYWVKRPTQMVNVVGGEVLLRVEEGHTYRFTGTWTQHPTYGMQVQATEVDEDLNLGLEGAWRWVLKQQTNRLLMP